MTNMDRHPKSGVYRFRKAIPERLRAAFGGRREFLKSLGTKNAEEAKRLYHQLGAKVQELFDQAEKDLREGRPPPTGGVPDGTRFYPRIDPKDGKAKWFAVPPASSLLPIAEFDEHGRFIPEPLSQPKVVSTVSNGPRFQEVLDRWIKEEERRPQTISEWRTAVRRFVEVCGDRPLADITKSDIRKYLETLRSLPRRPSRAVSGRPLAEQVILGATLSGSKRLTAATIQKHIAALSSLFAHANKMIFDTSVPNPFEGMKPRSAGRRKQRRPWTSAELKLLFQSPVYVGCQSDTRRRLPGSCLVWDHDYWLPLLAVFSGARLGELFQLRVVDVKCEEGIYAFDMLDLSDDDEDDEDDEDNSASSANTLPKRRFKNEASRRLVPIHPQLLKLGLLDYVERQRGANEVLLFPKLNASRDLDAAKKSWSQWFGRYRRKPVGVSSARTDFHSFRHGFKDRVRAVTQSDEIRNRICGHSAKRVGETYGQGDNLKTLSDVMNEVTYPELDLSHLEVMTLQRITNSLIGRKAEPSVGLVRSRKS